jgi:alkylation response protein AidB-like acyl-CoA dehydrogenase
VIERLSQHCGSTAVLVGAHQSIGLKALLLMGTEQQKREFLPALARGEKLAAFCLSEPEVGSDAANVQATAPLSADGQHWIINGEKKFATNAALAGFMTVMARHPSATARRRRRSRPSSSPPTSRFDRQTQPFRAVSAPASGAPFTDMPVPADRVLGQPGWVESRLTS